MLFPFTSLFFIFFSLCMCFTDGLQDSNLFLQCRLGLLGLRFNRGAPEMEAEVFAVVRCRFGDERFCREKRLFRRHRS